MSLARAGSLVIAPVLIAFALTGCQKTTSADDGLLERNDVGSVKSVKTYNRAGIPFSGCSAIDSVASIVDTTKPETTSKLYSTEEGDTVISALLGVPINSSSTADTIDQVNGAIDECVSQSSDSTRLNDLPGNAVGFRSVNSGSNGGHLTEASYAAVDDQHVVLVVAQRADGDEPTRTIRDLLPVALDRARTFIKSSAT